MKANYGLLIAFLITTFAQAQTARDYAVSVTATVSESPASVTLKWNVHSTTSAVVVFRKTKSEMQWGTPLTTLGGTATTYTDNNVTAGNAYEYYVRRTDSARSAHGYIYVGIKLPEVLSRGRLLLLVDANYSVPLAVGISRLQRDLVADGWRVKRIDVSRSMPVSAVKAIIAGEVATDPSTNALYLLGHIPVPYSGGFKAATGQTYPPDGHNDHGGAWPADMYYGVMNESIWTDVSVLDTTPSRTANRNVPGDGKFDQMYIYADTVALQIGRVDLTNMPQFGISDTVLMEQYLDKAGLYKTGIIGTGGRRALIDDNFGAMGGEAFAAAAWRGFSTMFGDSVYSRDYIPSVKKDNYLFTYGGGAGSYTSVAGVGVTADFKSDSINTVFTMLFGSYFGDWDSPNNVLRAPLCSRPSALASMWSGRPHWQVHHMSLGEPIGYSTRLTQNNYYEPVGANSFSGYWFNIYPTFIHIALMGDPTLRLHAMKPAEQFTATVSTDSQKVNLRWNASPDAAAGYVILRSSTAGGTYTRIGRLMNGTDTMFSDTNPINGRNHYMVRAIRLENTPSGTYFNLALGVMDSADARNFTAVREVQPEPVSMQVFPNPSSGRFHVYLSGTREAATLRVFDVTGKCVSEHAVSTNGLAEIDLGGNPPGLYFVKIDCGNNSVSRKIILE